MAARTRPIRHVFQYPVVRPLPRPTVTASAAVGRLW
jgi:hypothetical protein